MSNPVTHPEHYRQHPSGIECIQITEHMDFLTGNIIKYAWRAGLKENNSRLQDMRKCLWYAKRAVDREEAKLEDGSKSSR
jgi:hypothetical protein